MMGAIREESVGFLFNLEVEVTGGAGTASVAAKGLGQPGAPTDGLSYSAPSADAAGEVEVRNQRGQLEQAATQRAQQQQAAAAAAIAQQQNQGQPQPRRLRSRAASSVGSGPAAAGGAWRLRSATGWRRAGSHEPGPAPRAGEARAVGRFRAR